MLCEIITQCDDRALHALITSNANSANNRLSQSTATCKIRGFHGIDYEECRLLGCGAM
jgi:hypothetical protein